MKSSVEKLSDTRVKLTVEVPFDEMSKDIDAAYKAVAQQVSIPGFRKGKAPRQLIDARFGRGLVLEQVINDILPSRYGQAVEEHKLPVLGQPSVNITKLDDGKLVEFTAEVDVRPEITLPDFSSYEITVDPLVSEDVAVEDELKALAKRFATRVVVDRAAEDGDVITVDLKAEDKDGKEIEDVAANDVTVIIGEDTMIDGLEDALKGHKEGDEVTFETKRPARGDSESEETIKVTATVKKVQADELPELDDDFAEMASEFDTIDELREDTKSKVGEKVKADQAAAIRDAVLQKALDETAFELPEGVVQEQINAQQQRLLNQLGGDEKLLESVLAGQNLTRAEFDKSTRSQCEQAVRTQMFLDSLADEVKPEVSQEELSEHILFTAQSYGMEPSQFVQQLQSSGQIANLFADVRRGKALAAAICEVKVTDTNGEAVDPSEYFGEEEVADESDAAEKATASDKGGDEDKSENADENN